MFMKLLALLIVFSLSVTLAYPADDINYTFHDSHGLWKIVGRGDDLYLEQIYGDKVERLTNTPSIAESRAFFIKGGRYIVYEESVWKKCYIVPFGKNDSDRKQITIEEFSHYDNNRGDEE